jgi:hypothetical protein
MPGQDRRRRDARQSQSKNAERWRSAFFLDHDDFGSIRSEVINVIDPSG